MTRSTRRIQKRRRWPLYLASFLLIFAILFTVYYIVFLQQKPVRTQVHLQPGMAAPDFQLDAVQSGTVHLADYAGCVVLLSFISTQSNTSSSSSNPSNSQVVVLESMQQQYNSNGLRIIIVDATAFLTGQHPDQDTLLNYTYTINLGAIPLVDDPDGTTAQNYGVTTVPTTFLIGQDGQVNQRWNGLASSSQLAFSVQAQIGTPGVPDTAAQTQCPAPQG
jgi:peroxiredoxin